MPREPTPAVHAGTLDRRDVVLACVCGAVALAAYLRTLAPGLTSDQDSPLFQFIGRALGVAHNPGYPLFTLLTWPIAQLPIGELAWRINVFSAAMGAIAVGLVYLAARQLAARPIVAAGAALGFAAGATFWSQAVIAEVYTLHAALVAGLLAAAFAWSRSRRPGHFHAALGCLAAGLGHHTTILAFAPGLALLAVIVDRRFAIRLRTLATSAAIVALGVLPYALILVRSRDPEAYVESRATTLAGLAQAVLGRQFRDRLFGDDWRALAATQAPLLWQRVFGGDLTWAGLALAALGALWLLRRRPGEALLMASGAAIVTGFAVAYTSRVVAEASAGTPVSLFLTFGGIPRRAAGRVVSSGTEPGTVRGADTTGLLRGPDRRSAVIRMTRDDQTRLIGSGWSQVETDDAGAYRWTSDHEARLLLPPSFAAWRTLTVDAFRPAGAAASGIGIRVNGDTLPSQPIQDGWQRYTWLLPPAVSAALLRASAELSLIVDGTASSRGLAVGTIRFSDQ